MAQVNMVELQAAVPAKPIKSEISVPKAKAGSNSNSFSKHLQRLTRRSESKDLPRSNKEAVARRSEADSSPFSVEQKAENVPLAREVSTSQRPAEQEPLQEFEANEGSAVNEQDQLEGIIQEAQSNIPLTDNPVAIAQEKIPELPQLETVVQVSGTASREETSQNPGLADLLNELPQNTMQVAPIQEALVLPEEEPQVQVRAEGLQQPTLLETGSAQQIAVLETPQLTSLNMEAAPNHEVAANDTKPVKDGAAPVKQVMAPKLLLTSQDFIKDSSPIVGDIPVQSDMAMDNRVEPVKIEEAMMTSGSGQSAPEAVAISESPAMVAALTQSGLVSKPTNKRTDADNQGAKTPAVGDQTVGDAKALLNQAVPDEKTAASSAGSEPKQVDKSNVSDKGSQSAGSKESETGTAQRDLKFRAVAGMEVVRPKTEQAATDVKKLIAFESKRLKSDKSELMPANSETPASSKPSEGESIVLLAGKSGLESEKNQFLRSVNAPPTTDLLTEPEKVLEQIVKKAELMVKLNSSEMKIQLQPEFLGKMTIKIAVEEGMLTAKFITDSHQVKQMLDSNLNTLRQSLEAQGIRVEKTEVNVQLSNGGMFDGSGQNPQESWQQYQFMSDQYPRSFNGQGYQTGVENLGENDEIPVNAIPGPDYGIDSNGNMNFLV